MQIYWSLLVCLIGLILYFLFGNPSAQPPQPGPMSQKVSTVGLHMFWVGLFVFLLHVVGAAKLAF